jgi:hypothetical protein
MILEIVGTYQVDPIVVVIRLPNIIIQSGGIHALGTEQ